MRRAQLSQSQSLPVRRLKTGQNAVNGVLNTSGAGVSILWGDPVGEGGGGGERTVTRVQRPVGHDRLVSTTSRHNQACSGCQETAIFRLASHSEILAYPGSHDLRYPIIPGV